MSSNLWRWLHRWVLRKDVALYEAEINRLDALVVQAMHQAAVQRRRLLVAQNTLREFDAGTPNRSTLLNGWRRP